MASRTRTSAIATAWPRIMPRMRVSIPWCWPIRRMLVEEHKLDAVIKLPSGVFRPYAGVSTAILVFTKTGVGGTDHVWFYDVLADGWSLDDKRQPLLSDDKLGPTPKITLT